MSYKEGIAFYTRKIEENPSDYNLYNRRGYDYKNRILLLHTITAAMLIKV